jgi:uncharacterized protein YceK
MRHLALFPALAVLVLTSGCASIISGTQQNVSVDSNPQGADCALVRDGQTIGNIKTPGSTVIQRTKTDIDVKCTKEGYQATAALNKSGTEPWVFGNIVFGGLIGLAIDLAQGAQNKYDEKTFVNLPTATGAKEPAPATSMLPVRAPEPGEAGM